MRMSRSIVMAVTAISFSLLGCPDEGTSTLPDGLVPDAAAETTSDGGQGDAVGADVPTETTVDTPTVDTPTVDTPAVDTPAVDTPAGDTPAGDTPAGDTPAGDTATGDTATGDGGAGDASCAADCVGKVCGDDGCGGSCGPCGPTEICVADQSACEDTGCTVVQLEAPVSNAQQQVWTTTLSNIGGANPDLLGLEFYSDETGTFDLGTGDNANYQTCAQCVLVYEDVDTASGSTAKLYFQSSGTLTVSSDTPPASQTASLSGTLEVELVEVTIDSGTFVSTPVAGGGCLLLPACTPECDGKMCGSDGCGGSCGECGTGSVCDPWDDACKPEVEITGCAGITYEGCCDGQILQYCDGGALAGGDCAAFGAPSCGWNAGGYYDCATSGGEDPSGTHPLACPDLPSCLGKQCGDDGAGGSCGTCPGSATCNADGLCACSVDSDCAGLECATTATCGADGVCAFTWNNGDCDDGDPCTTNDTCTAGSCAGTALCDDQIDCTIDTCEASDGSCTNTPDDTVCDDGNDCTSNTCGATGCEVANVAADDPCDDGALTTNNDVCDGSGACAGTPYSCTAGTCELSSTPNGTDCTIELASDGSACSDGNNDTKDDVCDAAGGCAGDAYDCSTEVTSTCTPSFSTDGVGCVPNHADVDTPCGSGVAEPICDPDVCDGAGTCQDVAPAGDGTSCGNAGETCTSGTCGSM